MPPAKKQTKAKAKPTTEASEGNLPYVRFTVGITGSNLIYDLVTPLTIEELFELLGSEGYVRGRIAPKAQDGPITNTLLWGKQDIAIAAAGMTVLTVIDAGYTSG